MTYSELLIQLDLNPESRQDVLREYGKEMNDSCFFFVDDEDGFCYLFDRDGYEDDIAKIKKLNENIVRNDIKKIVIPDNVMYIGDWAFSGCSCLTSLTIPDSMTSIGEGAFWNCRGLTSITIPDGMISIRDGAFSGCSGLMSVTIPDSVTHIGDCVLNGCGGLTSVTIPDSVTSIGVYVFYRCTNLKSLIFKGKTMKQVKAMDNYPFGIEDESIIRIES